MKIKGINFDDVTKKLEHLEHYKAEDIFETLNEEKVNDFITSLMIEKMKNEIVTNNVRQLLDQFKLLEKYDIKDYSQALENINQLLEMVLNK